MSDENPAEERKPNVLFVEDNPGTLKAISKIFKSKGYDVFQATTVQEALKLIIENEDLDCLITDYDLHGENGLEVAKAFHLKHPKKSYAVFSGVEDFLIRPEVQAFVNANGLTNSIKHIPKPIESYYLLEWLAEAHEKLAKQKKPAT